MLGKLIALAGSFMQALVYITIREIKGYKIKIREVKCL